MISPIWKRWRSNSPFVGADARIRPRVDASIDPYSFPDSRILSQGAYYAENQRLYCGVLRL